MRQAFRIRSIFTFFVALVSAVASAASYDGQHAALVDGAGTYTRSVDTQSELAQLFFDQGLRQKYGYKIPEALASHLEALRHDPHHHGRVAAREDGSPHDVRVGPVFQSPETFGQHDHQGGPRQVFFPSEHSTA